MPGTHPVRKGTDLLFSVHHPVRGYFIPGVVKAGAAPGSCSIYAKAHNGAKTEVKVNVKNYAREEDFYNYGTWDDIYTLITDFRPQIAAYSLSSANFVIFNGDETCMLSNGMLFVSQSIHYTYDAPENVRAIRNVLSSL